MYRLVDLPSNPAQSAVLVGTCLDELDSENNNQACSTRTAGEVEVCYIYRVMTATH